MIGDDAFVRRLTDARTQAPPRLTPEQARTARRLIQRYGVSRAASILSGTDRAANADLAAWRRLGGKGSIA